MPKIRLEPKHKAPIGEKEYEELKGLLQEARSKADEHKVFLDLEKNEKPGPLRKGLTYVAEKEGIAVGLRYSKKSQSMQLLFREAAKSGSGAGVRISAEEAKERIVGTLKSAGKALSKSEIVEKAGISPSSWNLRIKELLQSKLVSKEGKGRETKYRIKKK